MYEDKKIAVVIPAYNVERQVRHVVERIPDFVDTLIVVDDGSTDGTLKVLESINETRLIFVSHPRNLGVGGAMKTGFGIALEQNADIVVKLDGDGQMEPVLIPLLIEPLIRFDVDYVKGNRLLGTRKSVSMPFIRLCGNVILSVLNKVASGYWYLFDPQNGYVAVSASQLAVLDLDRVDDSYFFENSMLIELNCLDGVVVDVPVPSFYGEEVSHLNLKRVLWAFPIKLLTGFCSRIWRRHLSEDLTPIGILLISGLPLFLFGSLFSLLHWTSGVFSGVYVSAGTIMIGALSILLGFQLILQGILLDVSRGMRLSLSDSARLRRWIRERRTARLVSEGSLK